MTIEHFKVPKTAVGNDPADYIGTPEFLTRLPINQDKTRHLPMRSVRELLEAPEPEWLVDGLLPEQGTGALIGVSSAGKSFAALDLALSVVRGRDWLGREIDNPAGAVYITGEGRMRNRLKAAMQTEGIAPDELGRLRVLERPVNLLDTVQVETLIEDVQGLQAETGRIGLVILDTLARMTHGGDEGTRDTGTVVAALDKIAAALGCFVLILHHPGHQNQNRARGHSSLFAALDVELLIEAPDRRTESVRTISCTKSRDGQADVVLGSFTLEVVQVGLDRKGRHVTSCVPVATETQAKTKTPTKDPSLPANEAMLMKVLHEVLSRPGCRVATDIERDRGAKVGQTLADREDVRSRFFEVKDGNPETNRKAFSRASDSLVTKGKLGASETFFWLAS